MASGRSKRLFDAAVGAIAVGLLRICRLLDRRRTANFIGALMRKVGPHLKEHRIGRANLRAALPEKSDAEIEKILSGVWDNLGRVAAEFVHLDEFHVGEPGSTDPGSIEVDPETLARGMRLIEVVKPTLTFACHLANWELSAVIPSRAGAKTAVLYRRPNNRAVNDAIVKLRADVMGELVPNGLDAPLRLARLLESGVHVGMLVDQHFGRGVDVTFFGRPCKANPLIAVLARHTEAPIHGVRAVRLPDGNRFWGEITGPIEPARDADGRINVAGTMQVITTVIEGWVREHPEQWLWLHRRWR